MIIEIDEFEKVEYQVKNKIIPIHFHSKHSFQNYFQHKRKISGFRYYRNLLDFLDVNSNLRIFFTLDDLSAPFIRIENDLLVNMEAYQDFCNNIQAKTSGRAHAFFGRHLNLEEILTNEEKQNFITKNSTKETIVTSVNLMSPDDQLQLLKQLENVIPSSGVANKTYNLDDLVLALQNFSSNPTLQNAATIALPQIQLHTLKANLAFLVNALELNKSETDIQNWIDEEDRKYSRQRCMIFGIEFIDPKSQGDLSRKKFDILAEQNRRNHIIIELKGPKENVFDVKRTVNQNGGFSSEYHLSEELARAIPQVLGYKKLYKDMTSEELEKIGLKEKKEISKCIIVIGQRVDEKVWQENFDDLKNSFNAIEIWTYTDLVEKLQNTISNLENNL